MKYFEMKLTLLLKKDVLYKDTNSFLSENINKAMFEDQYLNSIHKKGTFYKPYCFGSFYPVEIKTKIYRKNCVYVLKLRSIEKKFLELLSNSLKNSKNLGFETLVSEINVINYPYIERIYTLTPSIITLENGKCWIPEDGNLDFIKRRIKDNLEKKYKQFFSKEVVAPDDFIQNIIVLNKKPIVFNYKKGKLLGNRFEIAFNSDEISQKLASLSFGVGLLEKNSLGFGFVTKGKK